MRRKIAVVMVALALLASAPLAAAQQPAGKVWRIGLMGHGARPANVLLFLAALEQLLAGEGYRFPAGASIAAANGVYAGGGK